MCDIFRWPGIIGGKRLIGGHPGNGLGHHMGAKSNYAGDLDLLRRISMNKCYSQNRRLYGSSR